MNLATDLRVAVRGDVLTDDLSRAMYATDASIYQIAPAAVVCPRDEADIAAALAVARRHHVAVLPRGGATSLAGQTVGDAIQLDVSRWMDHLLELNLAEGWAWVEPGMVLERLNRLLAPQGVQFAPDVSPANRATIGGMIANNSSGMYSIVYGKTIDHVLALRVMLSDGSITTFEDCTPDVLREKLLLDSLEGRVYRSVARLAREHAAEIERCYPKILRRVGGYNLDVFVPGVGAASFNMARMIVGSEGTLGIILAAKIRLVPIPCRTAMAILAFETLEAALDAVLPCLDCRPAAVELLDDMLLDLTRRSREYGAYLAQFVQGEPRGLLQVEFFGHTDAELAERLDALEQCLAAAGAPCVVTRVLTPEVKRAVLQVRKASLPLLMSLSPDRKPETFVEDSAVAPAQLGAYIRRFRAICHAEGVEVAIYGHASVGLIHARPLINLKDAEDVAKMRRIAEQIRDLVLEFGGALSGEHGDGLVRSEFNRVLFGETLYEAFREIKRTFDPRGMLNPGKIVDASPMDRNLRYGAQYRTIPLTTHFRFADTGGMAGAVELCNGNGLCRKTGGGTMCPSYMVTRAEEDSTRGRANALRMAFSGALPPAALTSERMRQVMDLCLECKGCTGECPSNVNMTRLKAEWLSRYHAEHGVSLRTWLFGHIHTLSRLGSAFAPLVNDVLRIPGVSWLAAHAIGVSRNRRLPTFASQPFHRWFMRREGGKQARNKATREQALGMGAWEHQEAERTRMVVLFPDTFANYNEPHVAQAAVRVLEATGYRVILPERRICCGRPLISKGFLPELHGVIARQLDALEPYVAAGVPIIGLEPSCILTFRDEYLDLTDDPRAARLAEQTFLFDEFLARELAAGHLNVPVARPPRRARPYLLHGHCHQKALVGSSHALALLRTIPGAQIHEVDSGCCGMAGSFGYEAEHYTISQAIGERVLLPTVRALAADGVVVAMGTSCRQQIADLAGRRALHLAEALADAWL